ncbi:hypothetical protein ABZ897_53490 [Nonomuraea sp. NPDC046802]|uniref:hypothetical protein n=1 Tax=Nonomuraea sp. NPDC046802 TaxID=3154919 RepID=UPI003402EDA2
MDFPEVLAIYRGLAPAHVFAAGEALLATGGVTAELGRQCLAAGCATVGVGAGLIDADAVRDRDWNRLANGARRYLAELRDKDE